MNLDVSMRAVPTTEMVTRKAMWFFYTSISEFAKNKDTQ